MRTRLEVTKDKEKERRSSLQVRGEKSSVVFFLTDGGCKKAKNCEWKHTLDDQRRCWTCGGKDHLANACPRAEQRTEDSPPRSGKGEGKTNGKGKDGKGAARLTKKDEAKTEVATPENEKAAEGGTEAETMKGLLEEANKMLRSINARGDEDEKIQKMQKQLEELRRMKVLRLTRMVSGPAQGLLDSGATNPLRPAREDEDLERMEEVMVTLATGEKVAMRMTSNGVMVSSNREIEPIIPLGMVSSDLGYEVTFKGGRCRLLHPEKGEIKVMMVNGCPQIPRKVALKLIQEIEEKGGYLKKFGAGKEFNEGEWIKGLVNSHPVLRKLPIYIREALIENPASDLRDLPDCNRRRRKVLDEGFIVSVYAGKKEGYWLGRAMKEVGGDPRKVAEIDILRDEGFQGGKHDMLKRGGVYASLLRAAIDGKVRAVLSAPNCRSRSVLRHYPLPDGGPRPVRSWETPWGNKDLTKEEKKIVEEDDILLWKSLMIYIVSEEVRRADPKERDLLVVRLGLEQPADPTHYMPEVVTFWKTSGWLSLRQMYNLQEQTFNQSSWGGLAKKPTTFAGNLKLQLPEGQHLKETLEPVASSKDLARWAPGFMKEVAVQVQRQVLKKEIKIQMMSWEEHVKRGHTPFRRDCQICQEAAARSRMHRSVSHPRAGVLTLDVSGPYTKGHDLEEPGKFMLIGAYTWLKSSSKIGEKEKEDEEKKADDEEEGPMLELLEEAVEEKIDEEGGEEVLLEEQKEKEEEAMDFEEKPEDAEEEKKKDEKDEEAEERQDPIIEVIRVGIPIPGKTKEVVLEAMAEIYLQLRMDGFFIHTVHTDQGREFVNKDVKAWMKARCIIHSTTAGEDPKGNGRSERAVGEVKSRVRRLLHAAKMDIAWWPMALRFAMETERLRRRGDSMKRIPGFGEKVIIRRRNWKTKLLEPTHEETIYLCPVLDAHGHCVLRGDGKWGIAPYVIKGIQQPQLEDQQVWIGFLEEADRDEMRERKRIRGKQSVRIEEGREMVRLRRLLREEAENLEVDTVENSRMMFKKLAVLKKMVKDLEEEEQQILQTKIISPNEMVKEQHLWSDAIQSELKSLLEEKQALRCVSAEEKERMEKSSKELEVVPSKLVITRKAGGRRKIRIVACGNFIPKKDEEDLFASGSDAVGVRVALKKAAQSGWDGTSIDIKTAFLNAPLPGKETEEGEEEEGPVVLLKPPPLLVKLGYVEEGTWWLALKAMYGLRQSPKVWGDHRDQVLRNMEWHLSGKRIWMEQTAAEPNLWKLVSEEDSLIPTQRGLAIVYVDDVLILGEKKIVESVIQRFKEEWEISSPEWLGPKVPVRFLGMDLYSLPTGFFISQEAYVQDLLRRRGEEEGPMSSLPITKDQARKIEEVPLNAPTLEEVRGAQRITGELMWLLTRSRPDLMYAMSKMCQQTLKNPKEVQEVGGQILKYLRKTKKLGLKIGRERGALEVFTDSSFGPGGNDSQGTVVVMWGESMVMWKAGRQSLAPLSTAESELQEGIEGMTMGDSCDVLIMEIESEIYSKVLKVDNVAAVSLLLEASGSWRTRHLRLRASHLRWRISKMDWMVEAIPGEVQIADVGTKALSAPRLEALKEKMGMKQEKVGEDEEKKEIQEEEPSPNPVELRQALRLIVLAASLATGKAQGEEEIVRADTWWWLLSFTVFVAIFALGMATCLRGVGYVMVGEVRGASKEKKFQLQRTRRKKKEVRKD